MTAEIIPITAAQLAAELELPAPADRGRVVALLRRPRHGERAVRVRREDTGEWLTAGRTWSPDPRHAAAVRDGEAVLFAALLAAEILAPVEVVYGQ